MLLHNTPNDSWSDKDDRSLASLGDLIRPQIPSLLNEFYDWLMIEATDSPLLTPHNIQILRKLQQQFWTEFFASPTHGPNYVDACTQIGLRQAQIGLDAYFLLTPIRKFQELIEYRIMNQIRPSRKRTRITNALIKKLDRDVVIVIDAYTKHHTDLQTSRNDFRNQLVELLNELTLGNFDVQIPQPRTPEDEPFTHSLQNLTNTLQTFARRTDSISQGDYRLSLGPSDANNFLDPILQKMTLALQETDEAKERHNWKITGLNRFSAIIRGDSSTHTIANRASRFIAQYLGAGVVSAYIHEPEQNAYVLVGGFGNENISDPPQLFPSGHGHIGQCGEAEEFIALDEIPSEAMTIPSGLGAIAPVSILLAPLLSTSQCVGVLEIGSFEPLPPTHREFLELAALPLATALESSQARSHAASLLSESQELAAKLESQHESLLQTHQELEIRSQQVEESENQLRQQQVKLEQANAAMQEINAELRRAESLAQSKNDALEQARAQVEEKVAALELASQYKSDFLANMSHELRTPLNSMLLLSGHLADNKSGRLSPSEIESAHVIQRSGRDLLALINEVLDLAKIEAGFMEINVQDVELRSLAKSLIRTFLPEAEVKEIELFTEFSDDLPQMIRTDGRRMEQILRNLMSNAVKFTHSGHVRLSLSRSELPTDASEKDVESKSAIRISVSDTGVGIPKENTEHIFEAFQQADSGTSRRFGGTGLGLSISRELATMLGGHLNLKESDQTGSTFELVLPTTLLPETIKPARIEPGNEQPAAPPIQKSESSARSDSQEPIEDDRNDIQSGERSILLIEDDEHFVQFTRDLFRQKGFKCLVAGNGEDGIRLAQEYIPNGILLDINLPGIDGWAVLAALKNDPRTRHIPVQFVSIDEEKFEAFEKGAVGYVHKPAAVEDLIDCLEQVTDHQSQRVRHVLVVHSDRTIRTSIQELIDLDNVMLHEAQTAAEAIQLVDQGSFDFLILGSEFEDMEGHLLLTELASLSKPTPPIVIYDGKPLSDPQFLAFQEAANNVIVKNVLSPDRLLDETALFLHKVISELPEHQQKMIARIRESNDCLEGRRVLLVEDDMRSAFALSALLTDRGLEVEIAEQGERALEMLKEMAFDIVLTDITMPIMDGYETIKKIRSNDKWTRLPILALTANSMREERSKSISAGANDYLTKPIDIDQLFSAMRIWLHR